MGNEQQTLDFIDGCTKLIVGWVSLLRKTDDDETIISGVDTISWICDTMKHSANLIVYPDDEGRKS